MNITNLSKCIFDPHGNDVGARIFNRTINNSLLLNSHFHLIPKPQILILKLLTGGLLKFQMGDNLILANLPDGKDCKILGNQSHAEGLGTQAGYSQPYINVDERTLLIQDIIDTPFFDGAQVTLYNLNGGSGDTRISGIINNVSVDDTLNATIITLKGILTKHTSGFIALNSDYQAHAEGENTIASGRNSHAGGKNSVADLPSKFARNDGGVGQYTITTCGTTTLDSTPKQLLIDNTLIKIRNNTSYMFVAFIAARQSDGSNNALFLRYGIIKNNNNVISLDGSIQTLGTDINIPSWLVGINAGDGLEIFVTGFDDTEIHWKCCLDCMEIE